MILRQSQVSQLLLCDSVADIERALISHLVEKFQIRTKNHLIRTILSEAKPKTKSTVKHWIETNKIELNLENLERIFELLIEEKDRKLNGAYYTPRFIVDYIIDKAIHRGTRTVCDCSCGAGAFLVEATKRLSIFQNKPISYVIENCIFGADIIADSVFRTKVALTLLMLINGEDKTNLSFNILQGDSLTIQWFDLFPQIALAKGFDAVIGNPPYVNAKHLPDSLKKSLHNSVRWKTAARGKADLFIPFIELGIDIINSSGILGYIVPNTYLTSMASSELRKLLQTERYLKEVIDFNHLQLFNDATIYTCVSFFDKKPKSSFRYCLIDDPEKLGSALNTNDMDFVDIDFETLDYRKWILLNEIDRDNIRKLEGTGEPLYSLCKIRTGMATLRNHLYVIENAVLNENGHYEKSYMGKTFEIEPGITREVLKSGAVKDEEYIRLNTMRIIFPYREPTAKVRANVIPEGELRKSYPNCYRYFQAIKKELKARDRGKKTYDAWYAYGRTQGLDNGHGPKLITPDMGLSPKFVVCEKEGIMFFTGYGLWINKGKGIDIRALAGILNSSIFSYYISKTSKRYRNNYRSYAKRFFQTFSVPKFTEEELQKLRTGQEVDELLVRKYKLTGYRIPGVLA